MSLPAGRLDVGMAAEASMAPALWLPHPTALHMPQAAVDLRYSTSAPAAGVQSTPQVHEEKSPQSSPRQHLRWTPLLGMSLRWRKLPVLDVFFVSALIRAHLTYLRTCLCWLSLLMAAIRTISGCQLRGRGRVATGLGDFIHSLQSGGWVME